MKTIKIKLLAIDIDGVLTDGKLLVDQDGREYKSLYYPDIDAINWAQRKGLVVTLVTGEDTPIVDIIANKLNVKLVYRNAKDKLQSLEQLVKDQGLNFKEIAYIGDSVRDVMALRKIEMSFAPADAEDEALATAQFKLTREGGRGAVNEMIKILSGKNGYDT